MADAVPFQDLVIPELTPEQKAVLSPDVKPSDEVIAEIAKQKLAALDAQLQAQ